VSDAKKDKKKKLSIYEEEKVQSPLRTMVRMFFTRKITILGLSVFGFVVLSCLILPFFFPTERLFVDSTQRNLPPSGNFMKFPKTLEGNVRQISAGNAFAAGIDNDGNVHVWGNLNEGLRAVPEGMGNVVQVSAGLSHVLALNDRGEVFTWGNDRGGVFKLLDIPGEAQEGDIVEIYAGDQISVALDSGGDIHVWGNQNIVSIRASGVRGRVKQIALNNLTAIALLDDATVACLSIVSVPFDRIPEEIQGRTVKIASNDKACIALLDDGTVTAWGLNENGLLDIPENVQGRVKDVAGGRSHFTALLDDGTVESWGSNLLKQADSPSVSGIEQIAASYYQNYAVDGNGKITTWGLKGYFFGTDDYGRDIFSRLLAGGRVSLFAGAISIIISSVLGIIIGSISGYFGGRVDVLLMRFAEIWSAIPFLPIAIILSYILAGNLGEVGRLIMTMLILGILGWPAIGRLVRAQMLAARENDYVLAARAMGVNTRNIIFRHIFPNILTIVAVNLMIRLAGSILSESMLSYLGMGIMEPTPTWGNMLSGSQNLTVITVYWWRWAFAAIFLGLSTLSLNIIGDGVREAIDPKASGR
jgi:peptide/nickel transport system permease protein